MHIAERDRVTKKVRDAFTYMDELARDERLRSDVSSAVGHGVAAADRARKGSGLSGVGDRLMSDAKLRKNLRALLHDVESAAGRMRHRRVRRIRNKVMLFGVAGGTAVLVGSRLPRWMSSGQAPRRQTASG